MSKILVDDKTVLFRCDKKRESCTHKSCLIGDGECAHTTDIEHALWTGEKIFNPAGESAYIEA